MKKFALFALIFLTASSCSTVKKAAELKGPEPKYDVVLYARPVWVESLQNGGTSDAVAGTPDNIEKPSAKVVFDVLRVAEGKFHTPVGGPSVGEQLKQAIKDKNPLAFIDYEDPKREVMRDLISVAVADPKATFGISRWQNPEVKRVKLYLKEDAVRKGSYYLVKTR